MLSKENIRHLGLSALHSWLWFGTLGACVALSFFGVAAVVFHTAVAMLPSYGVDATTAQLVSAGVLAPLSVCAVLLLASKFVFLRWLDWLEPRLRGTTGLVIEPEPALCQGNGRR